MKLSVFRSSIAVAGLVAVTLSAPTSGAQSRVPHFPTPGTDPATPRVQPLPATPAITADGSVVEDVIVRVNDNVISRSDVERAQEQLQAELAQQKTTPEAAQERINNMLRDLIDQQLLLSKGKDLGINADAEVIRRLEEIRKQNHLDSMEDLEKAARSQGVSFEDFKSQIKNSVITSSVVRDEVGRTIHMTQADEQKFYDAHKEEMVQPEQVRLSEILVPVAADADDAAIAAAHAKADEIEAEIKGGASFADVAKAKSGGPTATQGGDLGYFKRGALAKVLEDATFSQKAGEVAAPIRTRQGFVILKTVEHTEAGAPPLSEVEGQVQNAMYQEAMGPALRAYLTKLREEAYIDIKPGFVDSGASAAQTKPVFSAYAPPAPKKKKVTPAKARLEGRARMQQTKTGPASLQAATVELDKKGKPKKVAREKIRFGQAPRLALPDSPDETAVAAAAPAPGTAIAPTTTDNTVSAVDDPMAPPAPPKKKTRYASKAEEVKVQKVQTVQRKAAEKIAATPEAASAQEKSSTKTQSAPLGLNGDTATKKKKKRQKGEDKKRLQETAPTEAAPLRQNAYPDRNTGLPVEEKKPAAPAADPATAPAAAPAAAPAPATTTPASTPQ